MDYLTAIISFVFGAAIGSFLNVVSLRFNTGKGINGRSACMSCGKNLSWLELIPVFSFIFQRGACRNCKSKISWQYPLIEFLTGALFVLVIVTFPPVSNLAAVKTLILLLCTCLLAVISAYDVKHKIIPDQFVYTFDALALISLFIGGASWWHVPSFSALLAGPILALPFALIWLVSKGTWMGLGDAKLVLGIGWLLGLGAGANALILAFWIAAIVSIVWLLITYKRFKAKTEVPFGPYLIIGMYLVLIWNIQIIDWDLVKLILKAYL